MNGEKENGMVVIGTKGFWRYIGAGVIEPMSIAVDDQIHSSIEAAIELSECPCDPRRRHERLGQKVAVV